MAKDKADVIWDGDSIQNSSYEKIVRSMQRVAFYLEKVAKKKVSRRNAPRVRVGRSGMRGLNPSKEGESPKLVTGTLRSNISGQVIKERDKVIGVLGVRKGPAEKYARRLEKGFVGKDSRGRTVNQGKRPFLRPTVAENKGKIMKELSK